MCLRLLLVVAFSQAMSQLLTDAGGLSPSIDAVDIAGDWPALPLAGLDGSTGYLASQPDLTAQRDQLQPLPDQVDSVKLAPESDNIDPIVAAGCASSPSVPVPRTKRKLLRERQNVQNECPNPMPLTGPTSGSAGSASDNKPNENPRLYPGGQKRRIPDWFLGIQQEWKQCPPEKKTLCCTGAQEGDLVRSCAYFYILEGSPITSARCLTGGIYCCDKLVVSEKVIHYHDDTAIFDRDGKNCWPLFYRPS